MRWALVLGSLASQAAPSSPRFAEGLSLKKQEKLAEATAVFAGLVAENPADADSLEQMATLLGWQQRYDESIDAWRKAIQLNRQAGYQIGLARVLYWKGDLLEARQSALTAVAGAPASTDALVLAGDIEVAAGQREAARDHYQRAAALGAEGPELQRKLALVRPRLGLRVDAGGTYDHYDDVRATEGSLFLQASQAVSPQTVLSFGLEQLHQFGAIDRRVNAVVGFRPIDSLAFELRGAITPGASFLPRVELGGSAEVRAANHLTLIGFGKYSDYANGAVGTVGPGLRVEAASFTLQGQVGFTSAPAGNTLTGSVRVGYELNDTITAQIGFARGDEALPRLPPATSTVGVGTLLLRLSERWGLRFDYAHEKREKAYNHDSLSSGVTWRL